MRSSGDVVGDGFKVQRGRNNMHPRTKLELDRYDRTVSSGGIPDGPGGTVPLPSLHCSITSSLHHFIAAASPHCRIAASPKPFPCLLTSSAPSSTHRDGSPSARTRPRCGTTSSHGRVTGLPLVTRPLRRLSLFACWPASRAYIDFCQGSFAFRTAYMITLWC